MADWMRFDTETVRSTGRMELIQDRVAPAGSREEHRFQDDQTRRA